MATKTPAEMNKLNREFEEKIADPFMTLVKAEPHRLLRPDGIAELRTSAADHVKLRKQDQSARARRPRSGDQLRTAMVEIMRAARQRDGQTLAAFLTAATEGNINGCTVEAADTEDRRSIECAVVPNKRKRVAYSTLESWWTEAATPD